MGVDLTGVQKKKRTVRNHTLSPNPYIKLLVKLYKFLAQRTASKFNKVIYERLLKSRNYRPAVSLSRIATVVKRKNIWQDKSKTAAPIAVVVGDVTDDIRLGKIPALRIAALRFTKSARARIVGAGGEAITFDQLALRAPTGKNTLLLRGRRAGSESAKHFGASGTPGSHAKPRVTSRGAELSRGRRASKGYKRHAFKHAQ